MSEPAASPDGVAGRVFRGPSSGEVARALLVGTVGVAASFAYAGPTTDFVAVPIHGWVVDLTPGVVIAVAIQLLGRGSEALAFGVALVLALGLFGLVGGLAPAIGSRFGDGAASVLVTYFLAWAVAALVIRAPFPAVPPAVAMAATVGAMRRYGRAGGVADAGTPRRSVLLGAGAAIGATALGTAIGLQRTSVEASPLTAMPQSERRAAERRIEAARSTALGVAGLEEPVTEVGDFYEVDVNAIDPHVNSADWSLRVTGAVERELDLAYGDLTEMSPDHRFNTLRCVGEPLNGRLMDNALWTGVPASSILSAAGPTGDCECVMLRAADGYYGEFPLAALERGLLAYGMNGRLLPRAHGYPLRALVPGHWGEVNVKWLTEVELLEGEAAGYWEVRGWHGTGPVATVAKLHAQNRLDDGRMQVAGHAYAGLRGIERVEVSVDGGATWAEARLSEALPDPDTWRQWAFEWEPTAAAHEVVVRAVDGEGTRQPREERGPFPAGPTGWVSTVVRP